MVATLVSGIILAIFLVLVAGVSWSIWTALRGD